MIKYIDEILINPFISDKLKGELKEVSITRIRHLGVEYRLAFYIQKDIIIFLTCPPAGGCSVQEKTFIIISEEESDSKCLVSLMKGLSPFHQ